MRDADLGSAFRQVADRAGDIVAADNTFCVYLGLSEDLIREHSRLAGFPITRVNEVVTVIDPMTAFS